MTKLYRFGMRYFRWLIYALFFLKVENKEQIPADRNVIIVSNHISAWDPLTIAVSGMFYFRPMAKKELYTWPLSILLNAIGCIKVDRTDGARALALARKSLVAKETMLVFPEGTRSKTKRLLDFKPGAFMLAVKTGTPLLPCQIIAPKGMKLFKRTVVRFGPIIKPEELRFEDEGRHYEKAAAAARAALVALRGGDMPD